MSSDSVELKPCPFCGGEARISLWLEKGVWCGTCLSCNSVMPFRPLDIGQSTGTPEKAVEAWNTRTPAEPDREMLLLKFIRFCNPLRGVTDLAADTELVKEFLKQEGGK